MTALLCRIGYSNSLFIVDGQVYLNANPQLNYQMVNMYTLAIQCQDNGGTDTEVLTVTVIPAPYFTNLPNTVSIPETINLATTAPYGQQPLQVFFTVSATDISQLPSGNGCPNCQFSLAPSVNTNWFQITVYRKLQLNAF